jgi:predicted DNA-binding protein
MDEQSIRITYDSKLTLDYIKKMTGKTIIRLIDEAIILLYKKTPLKYRDVFC